MIKFKSINFKNFLSTGNTPTEIILNAHPTTLIVGKNGSGKCLEKTTEIDIKFADENIRKMFEKMLS